MTTNNQCNHSEAIAREMHLYYAAQAHNESNTPIPHWADLTENEQKGWVAVANTALSIIGKHALGDIRDYLGVKASGTSGWRKALYWAGVGIAGAVSCLVLEPGHISYSQALPETDVPPVVQVIPSKK